MTRQAIVGIVIVVASLALVASVDAAPKKTTFVSKRYHYSLVLPGSSGRWLNAHATANWHGVYPPSLQNRDFDHLTDMKTGRFWLIAAKRVPTGMTLEKWTAYTMARLNPNCRLLSWRSNTKLGGGPAHRFDVACSEGRVIVIAALHAHRGYEFNCVPGRPLKRLAAEGACRAVQRSFRFLTG